MDNANQSEGDSELETAALKSEVEEFIKSSIDGANNLRVPSDFTEILSDLAAANHKSVVITTWVLFVILASLMVPFVFWVLDGFFAFYIFLAVLVLPLNSTYDYRKTNENSRLYTWIYRSNQPELGTVRLRKINSFSCRAKVQMENGIAYECDLLPTKKFEDIDGLNQEMNIYLVPYTREPLCAELGDLRIWMKPQMLESIRRTSWLIHFFKWFKKSL